MEKTPEKLKVLKDAKVVDAGAQGFLHFLEGIGDYISGIQIQNISKENIVMKHEEDVIVDYEITRRYCSEALLIGNNIDIEKIKEILTPMGDSLIVAGNSEKVKVHLHTNNPPQVFSTLSKFGRMSQQKVDDMKLEHEVNSNRKYPIALLTDSIADLPQEYIDNNQIHVIPLNIDIEGSTFLDKASINNEILFSITDDLKVFPTSSQPTIKLVKQRLQSLVE